MDALLPLRLTEIGTAHTTENLFEHILHPKIRFCLVPAFGLIYFTLALMMAIMAASCVESSSFRQRKRYANFNFEILIKSGSSSPRFRKQ